MQANWFARKTKVDGSELSGGNTSTACIRLPWIGQKSNKFQAEITDCIAKGFPNVKVRVILRRERHSLAEVERTSCQQPLKVLSFMNTRADAIGRMLARRPNY